MSAVQATGRAAGHGGLKHALSDSAVITKRNLVNYTRIPEFAALAIIQSVMFVLLFAFVFGGAIPLPGGGDYTEYLMPGIFAQTITFAAITTAVGMASDMTKGLIDRFRSLPISRGAVIAGRASADLAYQSVILLVLMVTGLLVGWRINNGAAEALLAVGLLLLWAFAMSWMGVYIGIAVRTPENAQQVGFVTLFPLTFISNVFVPVESLPDWLQPVAEWNPVSTLTAACRDLFGNPNPYVSDSFPMEHAIEMTIVWCLAIVAAFAPLGVRRYRAAVGR